MARIHADRRDPQAPSEPCNLEAEARELLEEAATMASGRSARTLTPGAGRRVTQSLLALRAGQRLADHVSPGPTTLLGVVGTAVLRDEHQQLTLTAGSWVECPLGVHSLEALSDAVVLLTADTGTTADSAA